MPFLKPGEAESIWARLSSTASRLRHGIQPMHRPPQGLSAGDIPFGQSLVRFLPEERPIVGANEFNVYGSNAASGKPVPGTVFNFENPVTGAGNGPLLVLPAGAQGRISGITLMMNDMLETSVGFFFTLLVNGSPVPGYDQMVIHPRAATLGVATFTPYIRLPQGATVRLTCTNAGGTVPTLIGVYVDGWYWQQTSDLYWKQGKGE